ncbi:MAG: IS607 family transposase, partial [Candidatus Heimdallarchaeota archaeon]|nr:IS607 family transposase [Candidatus Heimdallarchaeota archaeon]MCK5049012.1 IS607 family transposase [Candidatus Heimdallarchaeota archaeon]
LISEAAFLLGVHPTTIRRWDKEGKIKCSRTIGNHRRINKEEIERIFAGKKRKYSKRKRGVVSYTCVSSNDQKKKGDLKRQQEVIKDYCLKNNQRVDYELSDVASGLNTKRKGIKRLFKLVTKGKVSEVVITYKDRLTRFGFEYLEDYFAKFGVKVTYIRKKENLSIQQEMVDDLIAIITSSQ